jgi:hypothetical protein
MAIGTWANFIQGRMLKKVTDYSIPISSQTHMWPPNLFFSVPAPPPGRASPRAPSTSSSSSTADQPPHSSMAHARRSRQHSISQQTSVPLIRLSQLHEWMAAYHRVRRTVPMVTFLPERLRDPNANVANQTNFRNLSRVLWDGQMVSAFELSLIPL